MKIKAVSTVFTGCNMLVRIDTDEGITGYGEATYTTRQNAVDAMVRHYEPLLVGQEPLRTDYLWYDLLRGNARRGDYIMLAALSGVDIALWDIKGKYYGAPVYQMLGGAARDRILLYKHVNGATCDELARSGEAAVKEGYRVVRFGTSDGVDGVYEPAAGVREAVARMKALRDAVGDEIEIVFDGHSRFEPVRAVQVSNELAPYKPMFVEDPLVADDTESYRYLRGLTAVPLGTGEKLGTVWDYSGIIGDHLVDYVRTDICNCGGISSMKKIAVYAEAQHMGMVPHGVRSPVGMAAAFHVDLSCHNFVVQEQGLYEGDYAYVECDAVIKDGYCVLGDSPGLGVTVHEEKSTPFYSFERPHLRKADGAVQEW